MSMKTIWFIGLRQFYIRNLQNDLEKIRRTRHKEGQNNNNKPSVIPRVEFGEGGVYIVLLPCEDRVTICDRPSVQV